ncbi:MAG: PBP1A family penicillin-binding protein, partial [Clostridia bacterium]|nr:PBP1A family penicillin-binding protein [Clostridia bacterium]
MANNGRRGGDYNHDSDFDWDEYDRRTSQDSAYSRRRRLEEERDAAKTRRRESSTHSSSVTRSSVKNKKKSNGKRKKRISEEKLRTRKRIRGIFIILFLVVFIVGIGMSIGMYAAVKREIKDMNIKNLALNYASFIYYEDFLGVTHEYEQIQSETTRIWVESSQIPQIMKDAMVSIEDERFYSHNGVDLKRTFGATAKWILAKVGIGESDYGGSTITQQVIKNITSENENKVSRKVKEMFRAVALEQELTKDEILTMYLNIVYFANNCMGVEAAANTYFNKSANALTLPEAASIAGITQYPSLYDPIANPDAHIEKRNIVLQKMYELGKISSGEYHEAISTPLELDSTYRRNRADISSYFTDQVVSDVIRDLQNEKGYSYEFATKQIYNGGLKIYSTVDVEMQETMEKYFADKENLGIYYSSSAGANQIYNLAQAGMIVMDPYTGSVKALVGGLGEKTDIRGWNRATQSKRQPGSSIKPLSVYAPALDRGKITETEVIVDEEIELGSDKWKPKNSYKGYKGEMTVKEAVTISANIPAAKVLEKIGLTSSYSYLSNGFHIPLTEKDRNFAALSLGGLNEGVSPRDMAAAYCTFVNSGRYIEPHTYTRVEDASGNVILSNENPESSQAISAASAYIISDMLKSVVEGGYLGATGTAAKLDNGMPTYGKTGTTDDNYDKWFVGYTPYYVGAVWFVYDQPAPLKVTGNPAVTAWRGVMNKIHSSLNPNVTIPKPNNIVGVETCKISGKIPKTTCPSTTAYFVKGTEPKTTCKTHYGNASDRFESNNTPKPSATPEATEKPDETEKPSATPVPNGNPEDNANTGTNNNTNTGTNTNTNTNANTNTNTNTNTGTNDAPSGGAVTEPVAPPPTDNEIPAGS